MLGNRLFFGVRQGVWLVTCWFIECKITIRQGGGKKRGGRGGEGEGGYVWITVKARRTRKYRHQMNIRYYIRQTR